jgi:hypothetical protein
MLVRMRHFAFSMQFRGHWTPLAPAAMPGLLHGAAAWEVDGGAGAFEGATGRIVSNFLLSDSGDLTDNQLGVLFAPGSEHEERP